MKQRKHIYVLATGGTIAGQAESGVATTGYRAGAVSVDALLSAVPELSELAEVSGEQVAAIDSKDMTEQIQWELVRRCRELLTAGGADGIVITHGTDTMEETAYFLSLLVDTEKPIVLTGAMRPATALSADGPLNLLDAVRVAASDVAGGMGVLVVMNNQIDGAHDVTKTHTMSVDTFRSPDSGALGRVNDGEVTFFRRPVHTPLPHSQSLPGEGASLPQVRILYGYGGDDGALVEAAVRSGARGIIYAGMGNGSLPQPVEQRLAAAVRQGIVAVRSSRGCGGSVTQAEASYEQAHILYSGTLNPQKARILLQLALLQGRDRSEIQELFLRY
ncbi:asparaginase [Selenomonas sp. WCA-380-WT-3B 3/]|uniref:asparaginase n=1 Tax=Selenomonas montiformis TaxID=2652285 RepID=A0A6I2UUJ4_9FIRM|nr:asparaginase [Selenomonas montiformis]MSV23770.1 asparaginase [Selenomonas montiformis]